MVKPDRRSGKSGPGSRNSGRKGPPRQGKSADVPGLPVRRAAVHVLAKVLRHSEPMDLVFSGQTSETNLEGMEHRDRAMVRLLVTTTIRRKGQIDDALGRFLEKPLPKRSGYLKEIMAIAAAQILFLNTPPHASINIAVRQCQLDRRAQHLDKLCNAVLRRLSEQGGEITAGQDAAMLNTPPWLWQRWAKFYGEQTVRDIAARHQLPPALDLTVKSDPQSWSAKLGGMVLPTGSVRLDAGGRVEALPGYDEGEWWVQDVAATLPPRLLGNVEGLRVADLCAAPGGKTAALVTAGAKVTAVDSSVARLGRLKENLDRLKLKAEVVEADILKWQPGELYDAVLLDAPCSATGTIRRHPDILYCKQPQDVTTLAQLQYRLIERAQRILKPGGVLVYSTCSLEHEEGEAHLERIAERMPELDHVRISPETDGIDAEWISPTGALRTLPSFMQVEPAELSGMDGFFAAKFTKKNDRTS